MTVNIAAIKDLLLPGLMDITGAYESAKMESQWSDVYSTRKSNMQIERTVQARYMGLPRLKTEAGQVTYDNDAGERFIYNMEPVEAALGYAISRKAIDDNLYQDAFKPTNLGLNDAFLQFWEIEAAAVFNTAATANTALGGDGKAMIATDHPYDSGTWANTSTVAQDLNEASLTAAQKAIRKNFVNEAGLKIRARAKKLVVPIALEDVAIRLLKTEMRPGTSNNDVNAILTLSGGVPEGYVVNDYFTSDFRWFLKTNIDGLIHVDRIAYEMDMFCDFTTMNLLVQGYQRAGFFFNDPRCVWGENPLA